jgi:hypothetical protein
MSSLTLPWHSKDLYHQPRSPLECSNPCLPLGQRSPPPTRHFHGTIRQHAGRVQRCVSRSLRACSSHSTNGSGGRADVRLPPLSIGAGTECMVVPGPGHWPYKDHGCPFRHARCTRTSRRSVERNRHCLCQRYILRPSGAHSRPYRIMREYHRGSSSHHRHHDGGGGGCRGYLSWQFPMLTSHWSCSTTSPH